MWSGYRRLFQTLHKNPHNHKLSKPLCRWSLYIQETENRCNMFCDGFLSLENIINYFWFIYLFCLSSTTQHRCIEINYETRQKHFHCHFLTCLYFWRSFGWFVTLVLYFLLVLQEVPPFAEVLHLRMKHNNQFMQIHWYSHKNSAKSVQNCIRSALANLKSIFQNTVLVFNILLK